MSKPHLFRLLKDREKKIPKYLFEQYPDRVARVIFEGILGSGDVPGNLELMIKDQNETRTVASFKLPMHLKPIKELYEHWTVGDTNAKGTTVLGTAINAESFEYGGTGVAPRGLAIKNDAHEDEYIMFVHGWRMQPWERRRFAETAFKRLYWQGYKGKFGLFSWPGEYVSRSWVLTQPQNYSRSEAIARRSGAPFYNLMTRLKGKQYNMHVFAHSMGNNVVSEALRANAGSSPPFVDYIATQSATEASAYYQQAPEMTQPLTEIYGISPYSFIDTWNLSNTSRPIPPDRFSYAIGSPYIDETIAPNYYNGFSQNVNFVNFQNFDDEVLKIWEAHQVTKPDQGALLDPAWEYNLAQSTPLGIQKNEHYYYGTLGPARAEILWNDAVINPNEYPGPAEILSHIIPARSTALGTFIGLGGEVTATVNMNTDFQFMRIHSAQFLGDSAERQGYWARLLDKMSLLQGATQ